MKGILMLALVVWPLVSWGQTPVYKCEIEGRTVYQGAACPEGTMVDGWNLPEITTPEVAGEHTISPEEQAARDRLSELARQANEAREQRRQVPRLDAPTSCRQIASAGDGYSAIAYKECLRMQQEAYDNLQTLYPQAPEPLRQSCMQIATAGGGGSYVALKECLERQLEASGSTPQFKY